MKYKYIAQFELPGQVTEDHWVMVPRQRLVSEDTTVKELCEWQEHLTQHYGGTEIKLLPLDDKNQPE